VQSIFTPHSLSCAGHERILHVQAEWLLRLARGLDDEVVKPRLLPKSVGCSKTFRGRSALTNLKLVHDWLLSIGAPVAFGRRAS
jgi:nucleotidyltransferase/DNA polymerase involved in DNA repair